MTHSLQNILKIVTSNKTSSWVQSQTIRAVAYNSYKDYLYNKKNIPDYQDELAEFSQEEFQSPSTKLMDLIDKAERAESQAAEFLAVYQSAQADYEIQCDGWKYFHPEDPADPKKAKDVANKASAADRVAKLLASKAA